MIAVTPQRGQRLANFDALVNKVHDLTSCNLRRRILLERIEPKNWHRSLAELVAIELGHRVTDKPLSALPATPRFTFCATDMAFGVDWEYSRTRAGNYQAGYKRTGLDTIPVAHAAAASACFPPIFEPLDPKVAAGDFSGGLATGADADRCRERVRLSDGGVYDNMGLEPLWKDVETLLVSDAGGDFEFSADRGTISDIKRYPDIMGNQARALRRRWLIASFTTGNAGPGGSPGLKGTYWATSGYRAKYDPADTGGYSEDIANLIAHIRTDLDEFSPGECAALENHGYLMADVAIKVWVPELYNAAAPVQPPYPEFMDEAKVRAALKDSAKQRL
jgi:NTE family protein